MRLLKAALVVSSLGGGCTTNLQHHAQFGAAQVAPARIPAMVGDVVPFQVTPAVEAGTAWTLQTHGHARFAGEDSRSFRDWSPAQGPLAFEAIVSPWDPKGGYEREAARGWLWFELRESGASQSFDHELPIARHPFREIGPVTVSTNFSLEPRPADPLRLHNGQDRVTISYLTPIDQGFPYAPRVRSMLLETQGKKRLFAEVRTNFGDRPLEPIGYQVTLSYPKTIEGPVEVILVEWRGHGWYYGPFEVYRAMAGAEGSPAAPAAPDPAAPRNPPPLSAIVRPEAPGAAPPGGPEPAPGPKVETVIPGNPRATPGK